MGCRVEASAVWGAALWLEPLLCTNIRLSDANAYEGSQHPAGVPQGPQASVLGAPAPEVSSAPQTESCSKRLTYWAP